MDLDTDYRDDDGHADPGVRAAVAAYAADPSQGPQLLRALRTTRLLVPVVARADRVEAGVDKDSHMAAVEFRSVDGRRALLAFTGTDSLTLWDPQARPVPRQAHHAAQAAIEAQADALVIDIAGPCPVAVQSGLLARLAVLPGGEALATVLERLRVGAMALPTVAQARVVTDSAQHTLHLLVQGGDARLPDLIAELVADPELALVLDRPLSVAVDNDDEGWGAAGQGDLGTDARLG